MIICSVLALVGWVAWLGAGPCPAGVRAGAGCWVVVRRSPPALGVGPPGGGPPCMLFALASHLAVCGVPPTESGKPQNDEEFDNVRQICKNYSTPPPIPKRVDSIAKNIDKYFDLKLVKRADEDEENAGERIEKQILNPSDVESDVSIEEEASERQLVPFTEDERSIPDVGEFQEPEILDAFPAPPVNLPNLPTKQGTAERVETKGNSQKEEGTSTFHGKTAPPKPQRKKKSNPLDKESLGGLKFRELMALVGSKSEKNSALIAELIVKNGR